MLCVQRKEQALEESLLNPANTHTHNRIFVQRPASYLSGPIELVQSTTKHTPRTEENAVSLDSSLVLESTGWEVETCAIYIEPYKENDVVCHSRKENCTHGKPSLARLLEYRVSL